VRRLAAALTLAIALPAAAGCSSHQASADNPPPPTVARSVAPAEDAGGACQLLDYDTIKSLVGIQFGIAAAAQQGNTFTCVTQAPGASYPDLVLAVTATAGDATVYNATVKPKNGAPVDGLGKVGFSLTFAAANGAGPGVEVGWLAGNSRIIDLRLRLLPNATPDQVNAAVPKLVQLAKKIDLSSI
jgi:hypothetical protein